MLDLKRVLIMAGGTGGHVFPGLALATCLQQQGVEVHWLGTDRGLESKLVPENGFELHRISIGGVRGKGLKTLLLAPYRILMAIIQSRRVIKQVNPDVIVGMGGFVSGPGGMAGWLSRCPLVIHEQNARAGATNKILSTFSRRVLEGFPDAFAANSKVMVTGNPVRTEIEAMPAPTGGRVSSQRRLHLLVLGGSLGAKPLNDLVPKAIAQLDSALRPEILHQTGEKHLEEAKRLYQSMGLEASIQAFIKEMAAAYSWADVVLCRAGALTVAELCAAGKGAILVPYPHAVDDHQTANADYMVRGGAAICVQQAELTPEKLTEMIKCFVQDPEKCVTMAQAAYTLRKVQVAETMVKIIRELE
jgi:UDP-N-acetylglucosamine--N-acetylmuramyl-(pentapeptide) pyrophosphoryl-undecaprenol N-acetylglucosamine transferase